MQCESVLEFEELRALLRRYLHGPIGRAELERLAPESGRAAIQSALDDTAEAIEYLRAASQPRPVARGAARRLRFDLSADPAALLARLRIEGVVLEPLEIDAFVRLLDLAAEARSHLLPLSERFSRLAGYAAEIPDLREVSRHLQGKILPGGALADDASATLARLRREVQRQRQQIEDSLQRFLRAHREDGTLQEEFVTVRDGRWVVPIVAGRERRVEGVIHGASGSGHTLFVEPLETIELNNELVRLHEEELREVHRLLREYSGRLRAHRTGIEAAAAALGRLAFLLVKAEFALDFGCRAPRLSPPQERRLRLRNARHPLLEDILRRSAKRVVPLSLELDSEQRTLLISGPNTGGKTVALKTVGLLAFMAHAGLPIPADEAEFPVFDRVLADIGDHQSLAGSLSSFSAHVIAVRRMLDEATADSLVLLDELGRATDPDEGGALGVAVLEEFRRRGAFTLASTHLLAMKMYGASTAGVGNASMGFNENTLEPTYVLRLGAPGKSAGLDIAGRLGLEARLIEQARARMSAAQRDAVQFLAELNQQLETLKADQARLAVREREIEAREAALEHAWERKYAAKIAELERKAAELAAQFEQRAQETIGELSQKARVRMAKTRREYQESVAALAPPAAAPRAAPPLRLQQGARVRLKGVRQPATVRRVRADGSLEVDAGFLKIHVPETDVEEILPPAGGAARPLATRMREGPSFAGSHREINLIGQRAEEAREHVDKFLDTAALAHVERVRIVHGHGQGILRRVVAELLASNPHVARFYAAPPEEGGAGATIVELK